MIGAGDIVSFWRDAGPTKWFRGGEAFDRECDARFRDAHYAAAARTFDDWNATPDGALALLLLLDQIPRNIFRCTAHMFATDALARMYAVRAIDAGFDTQVDPTLRIFFYLPFEHSEDAADQARSVALHATLPNGDHGGWAKKHAEVIARFGRFPHRNRALGRESTPEERDWLNAGGGF
ncbi:putative transmembrane protein [Lysobacter dokdonensis DS-58]|uniref:Putative transmembrane protein n=1 Tax=Lysobacter dokdonensis DS-58 TaxID=1300345 RepID=A0A0A2WD18_9GAMM|nr:DUF924 family protein [Lysobacter dokdonensis]KGQ18066.1 putative transmembrane protein [Lysobacter dokdonensis DS-58]